MSRLDARFANLERRASTTTAVGRKVTVWTQEAGGADAFTSSQHSGVALTSAELNELPADGRPDEGITVIVVRCAVAGKDA